MRVAIPEKAASITPQYWWLNRGRSGILDPAFAGMTLRVSLSLGSLYGCMNLLRMA
jgi:hypothetical protein